MLGIPFHLYIPLREVLAECEAFETNRGVHNLFASERIKPWRNSLPQAETLMGRVDNVIGYLHDKKHSDGSNILVMTLQILANTISQEDSRHIRLIAIASELEELLDDGLPQIATEKVKKSPVERIQTPHQPVNPNLHKRNQSKRLTNMRSQAVDKANEKQKEKKGVDFFISYNRNDKKWAEWIAWQLENAGYTTIIQAWDFRPGNNFVKDMQKATTNAKRTIAVLSPDYLASKFTQPEWNAAFVLDPTGEEGLLLPIKVRDCELTGLLPQIVYIDLIGLSAGEASEALLNGIKRGRTKPVVPPSFPGIIDRKEPEYPEEP